MKTMMKKITVFTLFLALVATVGGSIEAGAKKIGSFAAAKRQALKKVPGARVVELDSDMENGTMVYDVDLIKGNKEYVLKYRASDGKLLEYGWDIMAPPYTNQDRATLSRSTITKKAKRQVKGATVRSVKLQYDDGMEEYKVKLVKGSTYYELVYDSKSGRLLEYDWEIVSTRGTGGSSSSGAVSSGAASSGTDSSGVIGVEKARKIAQAKAPGATVVKIKFDTDDGVEIYEVDMVEDEYEYDIEINARTGKIMKFEKDIDD